MTIETPARPAPAKEKRIALWSRPWFRPLIGLILVLVLLFGDEVFGALQAGDKIDPAIDRNAAQVDIVVDIKFEPRIFHQETLAELGVFSGRERDDRSKLRLRAVTQDNLNRISRLFWVDEIVPFTR